MSHNELPIPKAPLKYMQKILLRLVPQQIEPRSRSSISKPFSNFHRSLRPWSSLLYPTDFPSTFTIKALRHGFQRSFLSLKGIRTLGQMQFCPDKVPSDPLSISSTTNASNSSSLSAPSQMCGLAFPCSTVSLKNLESQTGAGVYVCWNVKSAQPSRERALDWVLPAFRKVRHIFMLKLSHGCPL